jgi:hypothetical protein
LTDETGRPVPNKTLFFKVRDQLGARVLGPRKTDRSGVARCKYQVQWTFTRERQTSKVLNYSATLARDLEYRVSRGVATVTVLRSMDESSDHDSEESDDEREEEGEEEGK